MSGELAQRVELTTETPAKRRKKNCTSLAITWYEFFTAEPRVWKIQAQSQRHEIYEYRAIVSFMKFFSAERAQPSRRLSILPRGRASRWPSCRAQLDLLSRAAQRDIAVSEHCAQDHAQAREEGRARQPQASAQTTRCRWAHPGPVATSLVVAAVLRIILNARQFVHVMSTFALDIVDRTANEPRGEGCHATHSFACVRFRVLFVFAL